MHDLAVGAHGERAGDLLLLAHNATSQSGRPPALRGAIPVVARQPSRANSELPFIVAHPKHGAAAIGKRVRNALGERPFQQKVADVLLELRR